jgi:hypothetical protein
MLDLRSRADAGHARPSGQTGHSRPRLCLTWALDPATGKPVGRWVVEGAEPARGFALASAA